MQIVKTVQESGNGAHIYLPRELIGSKVFVYPARKSFDDIKSEIVDILKPHLEHIIGVFIFGSYARSEPDQDSDIDILIIADAKLKIKEKIGQYEIISVTRDGIEKTLKNNAVLILPILKEAKPILNKPLIEQYKRNKLNKKNTKWFIETAESALKIVKGGIDLGFDFGPLVYSLVLRIRSLLIMKCLFNDDLYSNKIFYSYLKSNGFEENKVNELYNIYRKQRDKKEVSYKIVTKKDLVKLLRVAGKLLKEVKIVCEKAN